MLNEISAINWKRVVRLQVINTLFVSRILGEEEGGGEGRGSGKPSVASALLNYLLRERLNLGKTIIVKTTNAWAIIHSGV